MKARLNKEIKIKGYFFTGRPVDRVGMVLRTVFHDMTVLVAPSPQTPPDFIPRDGERWEVVLDHEFVSYDTEQKIAKIHCHPLRELPEIGEHIEITKSQPVFEKKPLGVVNPEAAASRVRLALVPPRPKSARARKRTERSTNVGPTTQKGPSTKIIPKGTSRKSLQAQKRRQANA